MEASWDKAVDVLEDQLEGIDYSVVGPRDNRVQVSETTQFPFNTICHLESDFGGGLGGGGTGFLIGPRIVLTAGHCVFNHRLRRAPGRIRISPGRSDRDTRPYGSVVSTEYYAPARYVQATGPGIRDRRDFDYGIIILPRPFERIVEFMQVKAVPSPELERRRHSILITIAGYPADRPVGTIWKHTERLIKATKRRLYYSVDTCPGHSGSPIWHQQGKKRHIIGIHTSGILDERGRPYGCMRDTVLAPPGLMNSGVRITPCFKAHIRNPYRKIPGTGTMIKLP